MTVKHSFFKVMKEDLKHRVWTIVLSFYLFLMQILIYTMQQPIGGEVRLLYLGPGNIAYINISIIVAILCGIQGYSYLFSKKKTDFYYALPIRKSQLFSAVYLNGLSIFLIPCVISRLLCFKIGTAGGYVQQEGAFECTLMGILVSILGYMMIYHIAILGAMLTGNLMIALAATGILLLYGKIVLGGVIQTYSRAFFNSFYQSEALNRISEYLAPLTLYHNMADAGQYRDVGEWDIAARLPYLTAAAAVTAITVFASYMLYRKRPAEAAGYAVSFKKLQPAVRFLLVIPLALLNGYFFMYCSGSFSISWILVGILTGCITFHGLTEVIFQFNIRGMISHKRHMVVTGLICFCIAGGFYFNIGKYDSYIPETDQVDSAAISIKGLDGGKMKQDNELWQNTELISENRLKHMNLTGNNMVNALEWVEEIVTGNKDFKKNYLTYVTVAYRLKNGKNEYRRYGISSLRQLELFNEIYSSMEYKEGVFPIITMQNAQEIIWSNGIETYTVNWDIQEKETFLRIYREELGSLSIYDAQQNDPIGSIMVDADKTGYLYPTFIRTIAYLKERGIPADKKIGDYEIEWILTIHNKEAEKNLYNYKHKEMVIDWMKVYRDKKEIDVLKQHLVPAKYAVNQLLHPFDTTYEITVKYKDSIGRTAAKVICQTADGAVFSNLNLNR